jgi:adenylate cyclase
MSEEQAKRKLAAILSADAKDYSRLMEDDEEATVRTITEYRELMVSQIQNQNGRVVDAKGDNLLAEFSSVVDAVRCAVEIQRELGRRNAELPEHRKMEFRIGVNLGDVIEEGETIYGDGVNIAARLEALSEGGGICISGTAFDQIRKRLSVGYEYLGEQAVKNIETLVRVYRVLMEPEAAGKIIGEERPKQKHWRWAIVGGVAVLIILAGALAIWNFYLRPDVEPASVERMAFSLPDKPSIAVLPFDNLSGDPEQEYFSDGLTEEIITALSKVPKLFVIARNSTFSYKGKPVKVNQIAEELGIRYVLEGSVRKAEDKVRITAQLIDALTGHHLWAERYDRDLKDIFVLYDEITMKIINALQVELTEGEHARLWGKGTDNLEAYLKSLRARELALAQTKENNALAQRMAEEAIALDPEYAPSYHYLSVTHFMDVMFRTTKSPQQSMKRAVESIQKAIALDDSYAAAHGWLGLLYTMLREHEKGIMEAQKGVALDPNGANSHYFLNWTLRFAGRFEEAVQVIEKSIRLNPFPPVVYFQGACLSYIGAGRHEEAIAAAKNAVTVAPNAPYSQVALAAAYSLAGREKEARSAAEQVLRIDPNFSLELYSKTLPYKDEADREHYVGALRKAGLPDKPPLPLPIKPSIAVLPFVNMSGDPDQEYFSDGITEEIITALSKVPDLFVIARNSSFTYKGKSVWIPTVGRELGVRHVVEGSVRKAGNKVRITTQLIDAKTNQHLWAERYDRDLKDVFAIQDEIALQIIRAMQVKLTEGEQARLYGKKTDNLEAYLKVLQARDHFYRINKEGNAMARKMLKEAIVLDPNYALAYRFLAGTHHLDVTLGLSKSPKQSLGMAIKLTKKAIALDESLAEAHGLLGYLYLMIRQHEKAIAQGERALTLAPSSAENHAWLATILCFADRPEEAIDNWKKAIRLDPIPPSWYLAVMGIAYREAGRYEEAIAAAKKALQRKPNNVLAYIVLAATYSQMNNENEARAAAAEIIRLNPKYTLKHAAKVRPHVNPKSTERFIEALRRAGLK